MSAVATINTFSIAKINDGVGSILMIKIPDCMIVNTFLPNNFFAYNNILQIIFAPILTFFTTNADGICVFDSFCGFQKIKLSRAQRKKFENFGMLQYM